VGKEKILNSKGKGRTNHRIMSKRGVHVLETKKKEPKKKKKEEVQNERGKPKSNVAMEGRKKET